MSPCFVECLQGVGSMNSPSCSSTEDLNILPLEHDAVTDDETDEVVETLGYVMVEEPPEMRSTYPIVTGYNYVGREEECEVRLNIKHLSQVHCRIQAMKEGEEVIILAEDMDSKNHTHISHNNGVKWVRLVPLCKYFITHGTALKFGRVTCRYESVGGPVVKPALLESQYPLSLDLEAEARPKKKREASISSTGPTQLIAPASVQPADGVASTQVVEALLTPSLLPDCKVSTAPQDEKTKLTPTLLVGNIDPPSEIDPTLPQEPPPEHQQQAKPNSHTTTTTTSTIESTLQQVSLDPTLRVNFSPVTPGTASPKGRKNHLKNGNVNAIPLMVVTTPNGAGSPDSRTEDESPPVRSAKRARKIRELARSSSTERAVSSSSSETPPIKRRKFHMQKRAKKNPPAPKPKPPGPSIMATGIILSDKHTEAITSMGGSVVTEPIKCTVLITNEIKRTVKLLCAMSVCDAIVPIDWLDKCIAEDRWVPTDDFMFKNTAIEKKFGFNLKKALDRTSKNPVFSGLTFVLSPNVFPQDPSNLGLRDIIECGAGKVHKGKGAPKDSIVLTLTEDAQHCRKHYPNAQQFVTTEWLFLASLRQRLPTPRENIVLTVQEAHPSDTIPSAT
eukprot:TRINITY_DN6469_c0_g1_i1.p1 TRINITY_DN6469_c0_g1~~TRINITY_DN6469_c0_g1_i1.p1  ORF type:complete len:617 (+),score=155.30 TRINITY_DN6469_c0_g1_i1:610-2460(+)